MEANNHTLLAEFVLSIVFGAVLGMGRKAEYNLVRDSVVSDLTCPSSRRNKDDMIF